MVVIIFPKIDIINSEARNGLVVESKQPRCRTNSGVLQEQAQANGMVRQWVRQEQQGKGGCNDKLRQRRDNGGNESTKQPSVKELLHSLRNAKDGLTVLEIGSCDSSNHKHAGRDANLTTDQDGL